EEEGIKTNGDSVPMTTILISINAPRKRGLKPSLACHRRRAERAYFNQRPEEAGIKTNERSAV
ncbi:hypothetical protein, partial [Herpetosiphon sp.]|uniref:hypothetical protein n=1 Tax=Herpetosiphon sp. TaxID=71864 RepID=UPI002580BDE0